jgi:hypothetical protein
MSGGSQLINNWLGAKPVVELTELLWTRVVTGNHLLHLL